MRPQVGDTYTLGGQPCRLTHVAGILTPYKRKGQDTRTIAFQVTGVTEDGRVFVGRVPL